MDVEIEGARQDLQRELKKKKEREERGGLRYL
jgi:hypothetical protein